MMDARTRVPVHVRRAAERAFMAAAVVSAIVPDLTAQAPTTFAACYVPSVGAVYRIREAGLPTACLAPTHVEFSWTDGSASAQPGGDLSGSFPDVTVSGLQGNPIAAEPPTNGDALIWNGTSWTPAVPPNGVIEHGLLVGLDDNDHPQYAIAANAVLDADGAGGDLSGTYPNPTVQRLRGVTVLAATPAPGQYLGFDGAGWGPTSPPGGGSEHGALAGLADDDHLQYVLADGTRTSVNGLAVSGTLGVGTIPVDGPGVRMLWYPARAAFRAGSVTGGHWNDANVGSSSVAIGGNTIASGNNSTSIGGLTIASGLASVALGGGAIASGDYATATGAGAAAAGDYSFATGQQSAANGLASVAMGGGVTADGDYGTAFGSGTSAAGDYGFAAGQQSAASAAGAVAMGLNTTASGIASAAFGEGSIASGVAATAMGRSSIASGTASMALGDGARAEQFGTAMGYFATAGQYGVAIGPDTEAALASVALGRWAIASGNVSVALGSYASTNGMLGAFVYGDASTSTPVTAQAENSFTVRAAGGYRLFSNTQLTAGVTLAPGSGSWASVSDRNLKTDFREEDGERVLAAISEIPIRSWSYASEDPSIRHLGPMAQDFWAAFGVGTDDRTIHTVDADGVNLLAIQALEARTRHLAEENRALRQRLAALEALLTR